MSPSPSAGPDSPVPPQGPGELLRPGMQLNGVFEIDAHLASGGMGEVYKGHSIQTGDAVAIKVIRADLVEDETALSLFRREAAALFHLHHEAIVRYFVFSIDPSTQRAYLAMEFVEGELLSKVLKRGPLPIEDVCRLAERIALGLCAAHKQDIIHRDVTPDNIIIPNGDVREAKIIDFGIARSTRAGTETTIHLEFAGKYRYASPEQLGLYGGAITVKSDIYSLGLALLEAVNGARTDMGSTPVEAIEKRKNPPALDAVDARIRPMLRKMLEPNPADRPKSMQEVAGFFRHLPRPGGPRGARLAIGALVALLLLIGSGILAYLLREPPAPVQPPRNAMQPRPAAPSERAKRDEGAPSGGALEGAEAKMREQERLAAERAAAARLESERLESEKRDALRREVERLAAQKRKDAERLAAEKRDAERREAELAAAEERGEEEQSAADRQELKRLIAERKQAIGREAERLLDAAIRELDRREVERLAARKRRDLEAAPGTAKSDDLRPSAPTNR